MVRCQYDSSSNTLTCYFSERLDGPASIKATTIIKKQLEDIEEKPVIVFDLAEVEYIASAFLRLCLTSAREATKGSFSVINTNPFVMKVFKVAGFDNSFPVK